MSSLFNELAEILSTSDRAGDFYTAGTMEIVLPRLEVDGVGTIAFPLLPAQAEQLIAVAEPSPYGRGEQTLHDPKVRRTWQIDPDRVRISGRSWSETLQQIVERAGAGLGVSGSVRAEFYKLLIYDKGSFFVDHRDTEKSPGMFGTLIIVLPSDYSGGELLVRHRNREARLELQCPEPSDAAFAAFYADCVHEVLPITSGCRLTLVYNLLRQGKDRPEPPDYAAQQDEAAALLQEWVKAKESSEVGGPEKLVYLLEHAYTQAELAFDTLKGADAAAASVLAAAAPQAGCDLYLALLSIEQRGSADYIGYGWGRRRRWSEPEDEDDFEIIEVTEQSAELSNWRQVDGSPAEWGVLPCHEEELCPPTDFDELEPDEQHFHEASGNEGASFERFYHRAALVLWSSSRRLAVMNQAGLPATLNYLKVLAQTWSDSGEDKTSSVWYTAHELASHMMHTWPKSPWSLYPPVATSGKASEMLDCLMRLRDSEHIATFLNTISAAGIYNEGDNQALVRAAALLPTGQAIRSIERIVAANATEQLNACAHLLRLCSEAAWLDGQPQQLIGVANTLVKALPGDPQRAPEGASWRYGRDLNAGLIRNLLTAVLRIDTELAVQTVEYLLAWPDRYGLDSVILPAVLALREEPTMRDAAPVQRLRSVCIAHLQARIAEPLAPPSDWARPAKLSCRCADCSDLSRFLADAQQKTWVFKAAEARRKHLERSVRSHHCDLDLHTERSGSPYRLICTKNQASYERRARQRELDLKHREQLA